MFFKYSYLVFITFLLTACGGGGGGSDSGAVDNSSGDYDYVYIPPIPQVDYSNFKSSTNSAELIQSVDTSSVAVGIYDSGFLADHQEFDAGRLNRQNYDEYALHDAIVAGEYPSYGDGDPWEWAEHGTRVASIAAGGGMGMAPQAGLQTSMHNYLWDSFNTTNYTNSFTTDEYGFIEGESRCFKQVNYYPWCIDDSTYHALKMKEASTQPLVAVNYSFSTPFGVYQTGIDVSFDLAKWEDGSWVDEFYNKARPQDSWGTYDVNTEYNALLEAMNNGETVFVVAAGNYAESLTQDSVLPWQDKMATSDYEYKATVVHHLFDPTSDDNHDGIIEAEERGITDGILYVGSLNSSGRLAWYSNYPGSSPEAQARFIVAPGDFNSADSYGLDSYSYDNGTSFAAPVVTGAIALLKAKHPDIETHEIVKAMLNTASKDISDYSPEKYGQGLLDVAAADAHLSLTN